MLAGRQRNRAVLEMRAGEAFVNALKRRDLSALRFSGRGDNRALRGRRQLQEEEMQIPLKINGSKLLIGCILNLSHDGKTEILGQT